MRDFQGKPHGLISKQRRSSWLKCRFRTVEEDQANGLAVGALQTCLCHWCTGGKAHMFDVSKAQ